MELHTRTKSYYHEFPLSLNADENIVKSKSSADNQENKNSRSESSDAIKNETDLPILATANDLREAVKFFKHRLNGVSVVEVMNAEPRRVFDARKVAAYEFWGIIEREEERLQLTVLGEELAENTEIECEINRRILHSIPAYRAAIEWIYRQKIEIAAYYDVADFWRHSPNDINLSIDNENNIEAVIVSFFSLCHAAELGTATVGKRGQPARLNVNFEQLDIFLKSTFERHENKKFSSAIFQNGCIVNTDHREKVNCVYISGESSGSVIKNLSAALELADFTTIANIEKSASHELLPAAQLASMKQCQAAIFLLGEKDCIKSKDNFVLQCRRVAELSVAQALYNQRVIVLWQNSEIPPDSLRKSGVNLFVSETFDWEMNVKLVRHLKNLSN